MTSLGSTLARRAAALGGKVLAAATQGIAALRASAKPLHPAGELWAGRVTRHGRSSEVSGVDWIDRAGEDEVLVRLSKAIGLPDGAPDVHGIALRILGEDGPADLLFATTGTGRLGRFVLLPSWGTSTQSLTTLLPYRSPTGPLLLRADHRHDPVEAVELSWARPTSEWHRFATVRLEESHGDPPISFDPLLHQLQGLAQYPAVRRLREPAYLRARRSRGENPRGED